MKTEHSITVGDLVLVLRSDGGVYLGRPETTSGFSIISRDLLRVGSSSAICAALAKAFADMATHIREVK